MPAARADIGTSEWPVMPGLVFIYLDARKELGHHFEFIWATPEGWEMQGWPKDRPVY